MEVKVFGVEKGKDNIWVIPVVIDAVQNRDGTWDGKQGFESGGKGSKKEKKECHHLSWSQGVSEVRK